MAKNPAKKNEQNSHNSTPSQEPPLITGSLADVLVTEPVDDGVEYESLSQPQPLTAPEQAAPASDWSAIQDAWDVAAPTTPDAPAVGVTADEAATDTSNLAVPAAAEVPIVQAAPENTVPETQPVAPEQQPQEQESDVPPAIAAEAQPLPTGSVRQQVTQQPAAAKTATRLDVESVLAEGLTDIYLTMTPEEQAAFREKGEEISGTIEQLVTTFHATTKKVLKLIREWLRLIPRVNQYFLEQESKIKTDEIMKIQRKVKKDRRSHIDMV